MPGIRFCQELFMHFLSRIRIERTCVSTGCTKTTFSHKRDLFTLEGQRDKDRTERTWERRKGTRDRVMVIYPQDKELPPDGEETGVAHRQRVVCKEKGGSCVRVIWCVLIGHVN